MTETSVDFFGRIKSLLDVFGPGVLLAIIIVGIIVAFIAFQKGTGLLLFAMFCSYAVGVVEFGGVIYIATIVRWGCLFLLALGLFQNFQMPKFSFLFFLAYAFLGFIFVFRSPFPMWSLQLAMLLLLVVIVVPVSACKYLVSYDNIARLFKMGIFAAALWTLVVASFFNQFMYSNELRLAGGSAVGAFAFSGAYFAPMVIWGIFQKQHVFWRLLSILVIAPFTLFLFLTGARTAIFGLLIIASLPIFFLKGKPQKVIFQLVVFGLLAFAGIMYLYYFMPDRFDFLMGRIMSAQTSGRIDYWSRALEWCFDKSVVLGMGIGSADASYNEFGYFHNAYLIIWYNSGLLGLLLVLCFLLVYLVRGLRAIWKSTTSETGDYARVAFGYLIGIISVGFFEESMAGSAGISVFMLLLITSLIDSLERLETEKVYTDSLEGDCLYETAS